MIYLARKVSKWPALFTTWDWFTTRCKNMMSRLNAMKNVSRSKSTFWERKTLNARSLWAIWECFMTIWNSHKKPYKCMNEVFLSSKKFQDARVSMWQLRLIISQWFIKDRTTTIRLRNIIQSRYKLSRVSREKKI